ncbi:hypothetical protein [Frateuria defendens]|uniref:hypothetical protein n=1 Tax=Frateuria defendens TaxID=2219559 RepID=UPI001293F2F0|nr:hypothetical protein [Frateuria defendens]
MKNFMLQCAIALTLAICFSAFAHQTSKEKTWMPTVKQVEEIEAKIAMPPGTTLADYSRYYSGQFDHGQRQLMGVFIKGDAKPGAYIVTPEKSPKIFDGGCSVINFTFDMATRKTISIFCNGAG